MVAIKKKVGVLTLRMGMGFDQNAAAGAVYPLCMGKVLAAARARRLGASVFWPHGSAQ